MDKLKSRKLILGILGAILPLLLKTFVPSLATEEIIASVMAIVASIAGLSYEDVAKQKVEAIKEANSLPLED